MDKNEFYELVELHEKWLETEGLKGERLVVNHSDLRGVRLVNRRLQLADLACNNFSESTFNRTHFGGADLAGSQFRHSYMAFTYLGDADLRWADFSWVDLSGTCLTGSKIKGAKFAGANLVGAFFLEGICLREADLQEIRDDLWSLLSQYPHGVDGLREVILRGDLKKALYGQHIEDVLERIVRRARPKARTTPSNNKRQRPFQTWARSISDTPKGCQFAAITLEWLQTWPSLKLIKVAA